MAYTGSDTGAFLARLPAHPYILMLFQWALGRHLTPDGATPALHVADLPHTTGNKV